MDFVFFSWLVSKFAIWSILVILAAWAFSNLQDRLDLDVLSGTKLDIFICGLLGGFAVGAFVWQNALTAIAVIVGILVSIIIFFVMILFFVIVENIGLYQKLRKFIYG